MRPNILKAKGHKVEENQKTWKSFPRFQNSANEIISFARVLGHNGRKEIYEAKYPESKAEIKRLKGLNVSSEIVSSLKNAPNSFTEDTASKIGVVGHSETK